MKPIRFVERRTVLANLTCLAAPAFRLASIVVALLIALVPQASRAEAIKIIASNAVKELLTDVLPGFEASSGHRVSCVWDGTVNILRRVEAGEDFELVIIPAPDIDKLVRDGKLRTGSRTDLVKSAIGAAVRTGVEAPDISSGDALRRALLNARSIVLSSGPSSVYLIDLFRKMGIDQAIKPKVLRLAPGLSVGEALSQGRGDLGFTQVSELVRSKGILYLGPLSADVQQTTVFSIGAHATSPNSQGARQLVEFLTSPAVVPVIREIGMDPI